MTGIARSTRRWPSKFRLRAAVPLGLWAVTAGAGCGKEAEAAAQPDTAIEAASLAAALSAERYDPRESLAPMIKTVGPAVVAIEATRSGSALPFGPQSADGRGSGFIVEADGLVVTNHHVIDGARQVTVKLPDGRNFDAQILGSDPATDLAVLRLSGAEALPVVTLGRSAGLEVGDWVVAMGNPMGLEHSATVGIVSGKGRGSLGLYRDSYLDFLQTDADIAPGSSGGPLFNLQGEVIGINTAVGSGLRPGFSIPVDQAKRIVEQLRDHGEVVRGWLGAGSDPRATGPGAAIDRVYEGTPAARAGLRPGDVVEAVDGEALESFEALRARIGTKGPGDTVTLRVERNGKTLELPVELAARPDDRALQALRPAERGPAPLAPTPPSSTEPDAPKWSSPFRLPFGGETTRPSPAPEAGEGPRLGVRARAASGGIEVLSVAPGSLADTIDLEPGDVLQQIDGRPLTEPKDVAEALRASGSKTELVFRRGGVEHRVTVETR